MLLPHATPRDGANPTLLYGIDAKEPLPSFQAIRRAWFDAGGVLAFAEVRSVEDTRCGTMTDVLGDARSVDDLVAAAKKLRELGIASAEHLAIHGSAGTGLLVNNAIARHPDMFRSAYVRAGEADAVHAVCAGALETPKAFQAAFSRDAYHLIVDGTRYPAVLYSTAAKDPEVPPWQSGKIAARLQAASSSKHPVLLVTDFDTNGAPDALRRQLVERYADVYAFEWWQTGRAIY
jgi:prolyl oligopeptidase